MKCICNYLTGAVEVSLFAIAWDPSSLTVSNMKHFEFLVEEMSFLSLSCFA